MVESVPFNKGRSILRTKGNEVCHGEDNPTLQIKLSKISLMQIKIFKSNRHHIGAIQLTFNSAIKVKDFLIAAMIRLITLAEVPAILLIKTEKK